MRIKIIKEAKECGDSNKKEEQLDEMSAMAGGGVQGHAGVPLGTEESNKKFNEEQEEEQRLDGKPLAEMFSSSGLRASLKINIVSAEKAHDGHVERSKHQGLRNVMNENDDSTEPMQGGSDNFSMAKQGTVWKLSDFSDNSRNVSRVFAVLEESEELIGLTDMRNAILKDKTSSRRMKIMTEKFGYDQNLPERIAQGDTEAVKKYYQFLINVFLFWIAYNPMASAQLYAGRSTMLSKPTRDLAYAHIWNYVQKPSYHNPSELGKRVANQADFYKLIKDLDPALYELPEE